MLIDFISGKGGTGKTTLALHVAGALAARGASVQVVDLDPQRSALSWFGFAQTQGFDTFVVIAPDKKHKADVVIFDHPPAMAERPFGELVVLTIQPSFFDVMAARRAAATIGNARVIDVLNRFSASRQEDAAILAELAPASVVRDRSIYRRSLSIGHTLHDPAALAMYGARDARAEIDGLIDLFSATKKES